MGSSCQSRGDMCLFPAALSMFLTSLSDFAIFASAAQATSSSISSVGHHLASP
jgi:hypothetical protein